MEALIVTALIAFVFFALERIAPRRALPTIRGHHVRGAAYFFAYVAVGVGAPLVWDAHLARAALLDLGGLDPLIGGLLGLVVVELVAYGYHRAVHASDFLFRHLHQIHHSAERIDVPSAFFFHPLDLAAFALATSVGLVFVLGLSGEAAAVTGLASAVLAVFQHANLRTPRWLGYLVQRPENHALHHARSVHAYNYGGIALWDLVFGTFRNPERFDGENGYWEGASAEVLPMLLGSDVAGRASRAEPPLAPADVEAIPPEGVGGTDEVGSSFA